MTVKVVVKKNAYHDSVTLMAISGQVKGVPGVTEAVVNMGTGMNKELMQSIGLLTDEAAACGPDDLLIAVRADSEAACEAAAQAAEDFLAKQGKTKGGGRTVRPTSIVSAVKAQPEANLAIISVPGVYAAREAMTALRQGLHVMLFSDNVTLSEEKKLKDFAHEQGLLLMGPDCGTAIINGKGLCFANAVRRGNIGIVGASGTGVQEVTVQIDRLGGGVSQVLGTGGRDLKEEIGGVMMLDCIEALKNDPETQVIVIISKPPAPSVAAKIADAAGACGKPTVICFINASGTDDPARRIYFRSGLEAAARQAAVLSGAQLAAAECGAQDRPNEAYKFAAGQNKIFGLFCGGTLCSEAAGMIQTAGGSAGHRFVDLGDDEYTLGRPHPMIEPGLRNPHILAAAADPGVAVILLDLVLGCGSHLDPAGVLLPAVREARETAAAAGREVAFVAYVCGTDKDPQDCREQERRLAEAGVLLAGSNAAAARLAMSVAAGEGAWN